MLMGEEDADKMHESEFLQSFVEYLCGMVQSSYGYRLMQINPFNRVISFSEEIDHSYLPFHLEWTLVGTQSNTYLM
jgi:hypothetical protein